MNDKDNMFVYESFDFSLNSRRLECYFCFRVGHHVFKPSVTFETSNTFGGGSEIRSRLAANVFNVGLVEIPTYWKTSCAPVIRIAPQSINDAQKGFLRCLLREGMSEFFHCNHLAPFAPEVIATARHTFKRDKGLAPTPTGGIIVPVGGGRDSALALDTFCTLSDDVTALMVNPTAAAEAVTRIAGTKRVVRVHRSIDPLLLECNRRGCWNGHTPFSAVVAVDSAIAALLLGKPYIAVANELSSEEPNIDRRSQPPINHQVAKTLRFERELNAFIRTEFGSEFSYFSCLRAYPDIAIAQAFSHMLPYHEAFRSCNKGQSKNIWCLNCAKCVSVYLTLAPFLSRERMWAMFGDDPLARDGNSSTVASLLTPGKKPFECVCTNAEANAAWSYRTEGTHALPLLIREITRRGSNEFVPPQFARRFDGRLSPRVSPLLSGSTIFIAGFGLEGTSTLRFLLSRYDNMHITIGDATMFCLDSELTANRRNSTIDVATGDNYLSTVAKHDIVFRTPGIPRREIDRRIDGRRTLVSSNTALFFELCKGTIIGVTGTKGKSTTTSLIHWLLEPNLPHCRLIGNIGYPALEALEADSEDAVYCFELSSHQLSDLVDSPDIAVVLEMFPDHLDYYGSYGEYLRSKESVTIYQRRTDFVFYANGSHDAQRVAGLSPGVKIPLVARKPGDMPAASMPLLGRFNYYAVAAALGVGELFGVRREDAIARIASFRALPGRLETVVIREGIRFVCDIRSTCPEVTSAAINAMQELPEPLEFVFLGGISRYQDYSKLIEPIRASCIRHILLLPPNGPDVHSALNTALSTLPVHFFYPASMRDAIQYVYDHAAPRSLCLMSTAAPSTGGFFSSPEDKERQFAYWARALTRAG